MIASFRVPQADVVDEPVVNLFFGVVTLFAVVITTNPPTFLAVQGLSSLLHSLWFQKSL